MLQALLILWWLCLLVPPPQASPLQLDDCGLLVDDKELRLDMDTAAWYAVLGRPDRILQRMPGHAETWQVWDHRGIMVKNARQLAKAHLVEEAYFFFLTLDNPAAKAGLFKDNINTWYYYTGQYGDAEARRDSLAGRSARSIELNRAAAEREHYAYPLYADCGPLVLHGIPIEKGFQLGRLNQLRHQQGLDAFILHHRQARNVLYPPYRKRYLRGSVPYGHYRAYPRQVCSDKAFYWELAYSEGHVPIYLKLGQLEWGEWKRISAYLAGASPD